MGIPSFLPYPRAKEHAQARPKVSEKGDGAARLGVGRSTVWVRSGWGGQCGGRGRAGRVSSTGEEARLEGRRRESEPRSSYTSTMWSPWVRHRQSKDYKVMSAIIDDVMPSRSARASSTVRDRRLGYARASHSWRPRRLLWP